MFGGKPQRSWADIALRFKARNIVRFVIAIFLLSLHRFNTQIASGGSRNFEKGGGGAQFANKLILF